MEWDFNSFVDLFTDLLGLGNDMLNSHNLRIGKGLPAAALIGFAEVQNLSNRVKSKTRLIKSKQSEKIATTKVHNLSNQPTEK